MILLRQKYYSKPDSEKSVNLGGKRTKFKDMSEKQLKNLASYKEQLEEKHSTKKGRKDTRKRNMTGAASFTTIGAAVGFYPKYHKVLNDPELFKKGNATLATKKILKSTGIGAIAGLGTWELIKLAGKAKHSRDSKLAKEELERRGITDWKRVGTLEERNKEVLEDLKQNTYSRKLKDSRIGIGWTQDGNGKVDSEKYFRIAQKAADKAAEEGKSDEEIVEAAKKAAGKEALKDNIGKPTGKAIKRGGIAALGGYLIAKSPEFIERNAAGYGLDVRIPWNVKQGLSKNSKKIALGAGILGLGSVAAKEVPKIVKKRKAARLGAEINTKDRIKKSK